MKLGIDMYQLNTFNKTKIRVSMNGQVWGAQPKNHQKMP